MSIEDTRRFEIGKREAPPKFHARFAPKPHEPISPVHALTLLGAELTDEDKAWLKNDRYAYSYKLLRAEKAVIFTRFRKDH